MSFHFYHFMSTRLGHTALGDIKNQIKNQANDDPVFLARHS